ncbi:MAG: DNA polymerase III subunit chi [Proteobacteria bacterium]|nr:DNA polymerase III subunit chi [Pseudomonadota bacterium]
MTRVDFYILSDSQPPDRFACQLAGKVRRQNLQIYIHTDSRETANKLDELLWTHKDISFLPHALADTDCCDDSPITIGWQGSDPGRQDVLINLSTNVPDFANKFARIIEIVTAQEPLRSQARKRYQQYRDNGFDLHSHKLESNYAYT